MSLCGIKIARESVPLDDLDDDIQESIWYKIIYGIRGERNDAFRHYARYKRIADN
jgi:hypothetical protein